MGKFLVNMFRVVSLIFVVLVDGDFNNSGFFGSFFVVKNKKKVVVMEFLLFIFKVFGILLEWENIEVEVISMYYYFCELNKWIGLIKVV